jgi:hypothetical protein
MHGLWMQILAKSLQNCHLPNAVTVSGAVGVFDMDTTGVYIQHQSA